MREPLTAEEVMAFVEGEVAHYKRVRHVAFVDAFRNRRPERSFEGSWCKRTGRKKEHLVISLKS